jgi:SAM-dependent methyltransferase
VHQHYTTRHDTTQFITTMASHTARTAKPLAIASTSTTSSAAAAAAASASDATPPPSVLGEEWSSLGDLEDILARYLFPFLHPQARVAEIGVGGGRVARYVISRRCVHLVCMDISPKMLDRARAALTPAAEESGTEVEYVQLDPQAPAAYPAKLAGECDVVYSFDVLVHVDLHVMYQVFRGCRRLLKPGGRAFFSTANLLTPAGWRRFERQSKYTAAGFYCECWGGGGGQGGCVSVLG